MARGLKRFPSHLYARQDLMEKIKANWEHVFQRGEEVWIVDKPTRELFGPYKFSYYSPASAVTLYEHEGRFGVRRVHFLKDQYLYQTKEEAETVLGGLLVLDCVDHHSRYQLLIQKVEGLLGPQYGELLRNKL